jgi:hypothetical protein
MVDQKQLENVEYLNYLDTMMTRGARWTRGIKSEILMAQAAFKRKKTLVTGTLDLNLRQKLVKCCIWGI